MGELNEKNYMRIAGYVIAVILLVPSVGFCSEIYQVTEAQLDVREQLDSVAEQPQSVAKSLESVQSGIADSERTVGELEQ